MRKQKIQFIVLAVILIVYIGGYFGITYYYQNKESNEKKASTIKVLEIENYKEAQKILSEEQAAIFLMDPNIIIATEKGIEGFEFYPLPYLNFAKLYFKK